MLCIFDPGQSLPAWEGPELARTIGQANMLISNEYELELITSKTGLSIDGLLGIVEHNYYHQRRRRYRGADAQ